MNRCQFFNRMVMQLYTQSPLPSTYQQVEYLQSSGTQYILTNVIPTSTTVAKLGVWYSSDSNTCIFGFQTSSNNPAFKWYNGISAVSYNIRWGNTSVKISMPVSTYYDIELGNGSAVVNGTSQSISSTYTNNSTLKIALFGNNNNGSVSQLSSCRIYYFKVEDICAMYPCYRKSDNKPGMYDIVSNTFYTNAGTGEFTVGSAV